MFFLEKDSEISQNFTLMAEQMRTKAKKEAMLEALRGSLGVVMPACKTVGIDRRTHYYWLKKDPEYAKAAEEVAEERKDFIENQFHKKVNEGHWPAIRHGLNTVCKDRGLSDRSDDGFSNISEIRITMNKTGREPRTAEPTEDEEEDL